MAKIIYKEGREGQNKLSCIEGIEIGLLNGQRALIFPKYSEESLMGREIITRWGARDLSMIEALKVEDTVSETVALFNLGSPAANWVLLFVTEDRRQFSLPSLLAAMEIQHQKEEIDALAETIEGADLLCDYTEAVLSCSQYSQSLGVWIADGSDYASFSTFTNLCLAVPTILYREEDI